MGKRTVLAILLLVLGLAGAVQAHSLTYETATGPLFSFSVPRDWSLRVDQARVVASPADASMWLGAWELTRHDQIEKARDDMADYLSAWFQDVQASPAEPGHINGMRVLRVNGTAVHEGNAVRFSAVLFEPKPKVVCMALGVWDDETKARMGPIEAALDSLRPAPGG